MTSQDTKENIIQDIMFILDESGSMSSMGKEPVQAVNNFIRAQKASIGDDGATFSLWKFNTTFKKVYDNIPLKDVEEFTDFEPQDMTALNDVIGHAIDNKKKSGSCDNVICIILTDGIENSSTEYSAENIRVMIKDMEENHNWKFVYLGANQDAFEVGYSMGVNCCAHYECSPGEILNITRVLSDSVTSYRSNSAIVGRKACLSLPLKNKKSADPNKSSQRQMSSPY